MPFALRKFTLCLALLLANTSPSTTWASQKQALDRQVSESQACAMAKNTGVDFPVTINEPVLIELNHYVGTAQHRANLQNALARMETYRPIIARKIKFYDLPDELMAIPLVESAYQNLLPRPDISRGAGLWQFMQPTALAFLLTVKESIDERLDITKETDAALRYLSANKNRFGTWDLSILAYNTGGKTISDGIQQTKSHNAWDLIRSGWEGDKGYLAKVMAAVLIIKNPSIVR